MYRIALVAVLAAACAQPSLSPDVPESSAATPGPTAPPPVSLTLDAGDAIAGTPLQLTVTGDIAAGETVHLVQSADGAGLGPCFGFLGGRCVGVVAPTLAGSVVADDGLATLTVDLPLDVEGSALSYQAMVIRGIGGVDTLLGNVATVTAEAQAPGCTDPDATNFDAEANLDDGSCAYAASHAAIAGTWSGHIVESSGSEYDFTVTIFEDAEVDGLVATGSYTLGCDVEWARMSESGSSYQVWETTEDTHECVSGYALAVTYNPFEDVLHWYT